MQMRPRCGCGGMYRLLFSAQESTESSESKDSTMQAGTSMAQTTIFRPSTATTQHQPISNLAPQKTELNHHNLNAVALTTLSPLYK
jgi:hypothetical protein